MTIYDALRILAALITVLGLIGICALLSKHYKSISGKLWTSTKKRLSLIESLTLDGKRRLVIIRCDNRDHLVILGPNGETLIDRNLPVETSTINESDGQAEPINTGKTKKTNPFTEMLSQHINIPHHHDTDKAA